MKDMNDNERLKKVITAAKLYYQMDYSQQDIARKLNVSRPTVSRMLQQAKSEGIVKIQIMDPVDDSKHIAQELQQKYGLRQVIVVPVPQYEDRTVKQYLGEATAEYLYRNVKDEDLIATTWGTTLYQVALHLQSKSVKNVTVVQLNGGVSYSETNTYAYEIMQLFGKAFNTNPYFLPLPAIVDHMLVKQTIESDRHIRKVLDLGKKANIALFTVGVPTADSVLINTKYFTESDLKVIYSKAVGDICSRYIDMQGKICSEELNNRTIGIDPEELRKKEQSILICGGPRRVDAIFGVLQGKYANILITDNYTGRSLLDKSVEQKS